MSNPFDPIDSFADLSRSRGCQKQENCDACPKLCQEIALSKSRSMC